MRQMMDGEEGVVISVLHHRVGWVECLVLSPCVWGRIGLLCESGCVLTEEVDTWDGGGVVSKTMCLRLAPNTNSCTFFFFNLARTLTGLLGIGEELSGDAYSIHTDAGPYHYVHFLDQSTYRQGRDCLAQLVPCQNCLPFDVQSFFHFCCAEWDCSPHCTMGWHVGSLRFKNQLNFKLVGQMTVEETKITLRECWFQVLQGEIGGNLYKWIVL